MRPLGKVFMSGSGDPASFFDVRMRGFRDRADVEEVGQFLRAGAQPLPAESMSIEDAGGRVLAEGGDASIAKLALANSQIQKLATTVSS